MFFKKDLKTGIRISDIDVGIDPKTKKRKQKYKGALATKKAEQIELTNVQNKIMKEISQNGKEL